MMKKEKTLRIALSCALLLAVAAAGVTMYRSENSVKKQDENQAEEQQMAEETPLSDLSQGQEDAMNSGGSDTEDVTSDQAQAENTEALSEDTQGQQEPAQTPEASAEEAQGQQETQEEAAEEPAEDTAAQVAPELNFTEDTIMLWPVNGEVVIDYSMDATTYFPTLDQYKYNPSLVMSAAVGDPVQAAANGQVLSISEDVETGTTLTMDMGNGYQAVYGQLKDVAVQEGQTVEAGTIIGYVNDPTRYYVEEGANLYFAMTKDGAPVDPMIYIETVVE
ncbi:MAG TPA: M23 family metallopeptidase [Candidatus Pullilachnospira stercoravium]|uniref:M23 family metallopeptidase n=1 Tax=Candidatus Pullilachnospira stercoravium TaxID=2840913 RepID=A0A9D1NWQ5_9FIRM|nr:M23 family metallopeptidase [Candidatus Pullilachnospira stercoravium]